MSNTKTVAAVVVAAIVIVAAVAVVVLSNDDEVGVSGEAVAKQLQIRGNVNDDYTIDDKDMELMEKILAKELDPTPLADVNNDGEVNETDKQLLQDLIDRKPGTQVYVLCLDRLGNDITVQVTYPLRNVVTTHTNIQLPVLSVNGGKYMAGYFNSGYKVAESSISENAVDLGGTSREISDAAWANFTALDASVEGGIGALLAATDGIAQITDAREADLNAAGIPMITYESADAMTELNAALTIGFLFGGDCEAMGLKYAQAGWDVVDKVNDVIGGYSDSEKTSYICCNMYIYICQNDSTFNSSPATVGGVPYYTINSEFATKYVGSSSKPMDSTEALSNFKDIGCIINIRSMDWGIDAEAMKETIINNWDHQNKAGPSVEFFKGFEDRLMYIDNLLPGGAKLAYMAHAFYSDKFSEEWADSVLQSYIDMGCETLKGQTLDTIPAYIDYEDYLAAIA